MQIYEINCFAADALCEGLSGYTINRRNAVTKQLLRVMKLTSFLILVMCLHVSATGIGQHVTLSVKNASLKKVFDEIIMQSGTSIIYNDASLKNAKPVTVEIRNATVEQVLALCLKGQPFSFAKEDGLILIKPISDLTQGAGRNFSSAHSVGPVLEEAMPPINIKGKITDENGGAIIASVVIKGTNIGVSSNADGEFELANVDQNATLIISGVTIESKEVRVDGRSQLAIIVTTKITSEEEVTVSTGYWSSAKRNSVMNISKVDAKDIEKQPVTSPLMALQGRMAGVDVTPGLNNAPGLAPRILIRGQNTLRNGGLLGNGSLPLYVVDGIPMDSRPLASSSSSIYSAGFDPLASINPANIESIQVLKDAAATAIYGSRGANGVVLITTKQGSKNNKTNIDINAYAGMGEVAGKADLLSAREYLDLRYTAFANDGINLNTASLNLNNYDLKFWDTTRSTDWQKELFGKTTAKITDAQINLSGGSNQTSFRIGGSYHKETSPLNEDFGADRVSANGKINHISSDKKFRALFTFDYGVAKTRQFNNSNYMTAAFQTQPIAPPLYDENGKLNWAIATINGAQRNTWINPLSYLLQTHNSEVRNLVTNALLNYSIFRGLEAKINIGFTQTNQDEVIKSPIASRSPTTINSSTTGTARFGSNDRSAFIIEPQLTYTRDFDHHHLEILAGTSWQNSNYNSTSLFGTGYNSDAVLDIPSAAGTLTMLVYDKGIYHYNSIFGRVGYSFSQKYFLEASLRRDGSSRFGPGKKVGNFGAVGAGWIFTEEKLLKKRVGFLSFGKLRGSYGITGNDQIGDYNYLNTFSINSFTYQGAMALYPSALFNPSFAWEETKKLEVALEMSVLNNRASMEIAWYRNRTSNQLINYQLPMTTGFESVFSNFDALVENSGWEFSVNFAIINHAKFKWRLSGNYTSPRTKLVSFPNIEASTYADIYKVGEPLSLQKLYLFQGLNPETGEMNFNDVDNSGGFTTVDRLFYNIARISYGGISNTLSVGNLELNFLWQYSNANTRKGSTNQPGANTNQLKEALDYWKKPGDNTLFPKPSQTSASTNAFSNLYNQSTARLRRVEFMRLKTVTLSYQFKNLLPKIQQLQDCRLFLAGYNLLTFTEDNSLDPESGFGLPPLRTISVGVQLKF